MSIHNNSDLKILVVDDNPELLDITLRSLKKANYHLFSAVNGAECMEVLFKERPDIVLLDVMLPDANGKELAAKIKKNPEFSSVFMILLSALKTSTKDISEGLEDGADGYISRPVNSRELLARVEATGRIIYAERESKASLFKYYSLFSSMQEGVYLHEMVYDELGEAMNYRILEANPASEKHLNIKPENAIGKCATKLFGTDEAPFLELYAKVTQTGQSISFEQYFPPLEKYLQISAFSQGASKFVTVFSDITEQKRVEEEIRLKNVALQNLNIEKDKFFSIIAHDLRSPFNSFLGLTTIMAEDIHSLPITKVQEIAVFMSKSASNLYRLLENLLHWAQMQQGLIPFNQEVIELHRLVDESIEMVQESAKNKGVEITNDIPDGLAVFADSNMLQTVIRNLVSNAVKYTHKEGKVGILAKETGENLVEIAIHDTGIGMNQTIRDNLFRIDVETNRPGTDGEPSTGLGLLLCKEFVEKNGGEIWVESEVEKGSSFCFTLPTHKINWYAGQ